MATYYGVKGSSNWNSGNWSTTATKDASRTGSGVTPAATDDCILDDWSSDGGSVVWTINALTCVCKSLTCTGYAGELATGTFGSQRLGISGSATFEGTGMTFSGTGEIRLNTTAATITCDGATIPFLGINVAAVTLGDALLCGTLYNFGAALTFTGEHDITVASLFGTLGITWPGSQTITVGTAMHLKSAASGLGAGAFTMKSVSGTANLVYNGAAADCVVVGVTFTDVAYSTTSGPVTALDNWYGGTLTRTSGITNRTSADIGGGGGGVYRSHSIGIGV